MNLRLRHQKIQYLIWFGIAEFRIQSYQRLGHLKNKPTVLSRISSKSKAAEWWVGRLLRSTERNEMKHSTWKSTNKDSESLYVCCQFFLSLVGFDTILLPSIYIISQLSHSTTILYCKTWRTEHQPDGVLGKTSTATPTSKRQPPSPFELFSTLYWLILTKTTQDPSFLWAMATPQSSPALEPLLPP